ncbi:MAG: hypothetical protein ACREQN_11230 [Candidatus Binataceae bacterium]
MKSAQTEAAVRAWAAERHLPAAQLEHWLKLAEGDRSALLSFARQLHMRPGQFASALEMLAEIAVREEVTLASVLAHREIERILNGTGSAPERARASLDELRAIRFPRLRRAAERLKAEVASLGLPHGISVILPRDLSSDELRVRITARSAAELDGLIDAIAQNRAGLRRIADLLGGHDEV